MYQGYESIPIYPTLTFNKIQKLRIIIHSYEIKKKKKKWTITTTDMAFSKSETHELKLSERWERDEYWHIWWDGMRLCWLTSYEDWLRKLRNNKVDYYKRPIQVSLLLLTSSKLGLSSIYS